MISRRDVVTSARSFVGVPFHHAGRSRHGLDCVGLLVMVARDLGIPHEDDVHYRRRPQKGRLYTSLRAAGLERSDHASLGDVLAFSMTRSDVPYHVGIMGAAEDGRPTVIHAMMEVGKVEEVSLSHAWTDALVSVWRYPGIFD